MRPVISLIAAVADNGVIGADGRLPWRLSTDLRRFRSLTLAKPVIMGRRTFESLGRPLPDRTNIVITGRGVDDPDVEIAPSFHAALGMAERAAARTGAGEIMVIGGAAVYRAALGIADRLYITHVRGVPAGDAHFPPLDPAVWAAVERSAVPAGEKDTFASEFVVYERRRVAPGG